MLQNAGEVRVGNDFFNNRVAAVGIGVRAPVAQGVMRQLFEFGVKVTLLVMEETCSVSDKILKVPQLWLIHCRIVDLSDDAIPQREPDSARSRIGSPDTVFASMCPLGFNARPTESPVVVVVFRFHFIARGLSHDQFDALTAIAASTPLT